MRRISLTAQIEELRRELIVREGLGKWGRLTPAQADLCTKRHRAALRTLEWLLKHRSRIEERCPELFKRRARQ